MRRPIDRLIGQVIGRLTVLRIYRPAPGVRARAICRCECGAQTDVQTNNITTGNTTSCGCAGQETRSQNGRANARHGHAANNRESATYNSWRGMLKRCGRPTTDGFNHYGGRGIMVCPEWAASFDTFLADMGVRPPGRTLDRIDLSKGYSKANCRWATPKEQNRNKRNTVFVEYEGRRMPAADVNDLLGFPRGTLRNRLSLGWDLARALAQPIRRHPRG